MNPHYLWICEICECGTANGDAEANIPIISHGVNLSEITYTKIILHVETGVLRSPSIYQYIIFDISRRMTHLLE